MVLKRAVWIVLAAFVLVGAARESLAQPMTVNSNGQPLAGAQVSAMINGIKRPLGTTSAGGQLTIDTDLLNITKGTEVTVWIKTCEDGTAQIIMVPAGEQGECIQEGAQAGEPCGCKRAGVIIWGGGPVTIDVGRGTVTQVTDGGGWYSGKWTIGAALDVRQMYNLEDVLLDVPDATDASATNWAPGVQLLLDWTLFGWLVLGIDASYASMDTEVTFPQGVQNGDLNYWEAGGNVKVGRFTDDFRPYVTVGLYRAWNEAEFELDGQTEERDHVTRRDGVGAGLDYMWRPNLGLRFEGLYSSTFEDNDADEHIRWKLGLLYELGESEGGRYE